MQLFIVRSGPGAPPRLNPAMLIADSWRVGDYATEKILSIPVAVDVFSCVWYFSCFSMFFSCFWYFLIIFIFLCYGNIFFSLSGPLHALTRHWLPKAKAPQGMPCFIRQANIQATGQDHFTWSFVIFNINFIFLT